MTAQVRRFDTGATRDLDESKLDYEGFLSPLVLQRFAEYMHENRKLRDGTLRESDNWQKGIPREAYMKSGFRHFFDWWLEHRGHATDEGLEKALCALLFNAMGYLHEHLQSGQARWVLTTDPEMTAHLTGECDHPAAIVDLEDDEDLGLKAGEAYREVIPPDRPEGYNPPPNCEGNNSAEGQD
jgi:hypothetical protein